MSLTSQLHDGELAAWCSERLPGVRAMAGKLHLVTGNVRPIRPAGIADPQHWGSIGGAFGHRLAFLVQHAPPYEALLGAHRAGLAGSLAVQYAATAFLSHWGLAPGDRQRACQLRPTPTGWLDVGDRPASADGAPPAGESEHTVLEFIARLAAFLAGNAPPGDLAPNRGHEAALARACWVLSGWAHAYRTGALPEPLAARHRAVPEPTVADLTGAAPRAAVDELLALTARARTSGALHRLRALAGRPSPGQSLGYAGPVFVPHWAAGHLLLGSPEATTLLDVTTALRLQDGRRVDRWLLTLIGNAWLDVTDRYRIRRVGLYLARHGLLLSWPLEEFAATLLQGTAHPDTARQDFLELAAKVISAEGADPTWIRTPRPNLR